MKIKLILMSLSLVALTSFGMANAQSKSDAKKQAKAEKAAEEIKKLDEMITGKDFNFTPTRVPGKSVSVQGDYTFEVTPDKIYSSMPYYGTMEGGKFKDRRVSPLEFEVSDFKYIKQGKPAEKEPALVNIKTKETSNGLSFDITLEIYADNSVFISITGGAMQASQFQGYIKPNKTKK